MNKGTHFSGQQYYVLMNVRGEQKKTGRGVSLDSSSPRRELFMDININVLSQVHAIALALHPISETHLQRNAALSP